MAPVHGISWDDRKRRAVGAFATAAALLAGAGAVAATAHAGTHFVSVIVRAQPGQGVAAAAAVAQFGGRVEQHIALVNALVADVPADAVPDLETSRLLQLGWRRLQPRD
jgi:hypothetical protein